MLLETLICEHACQAASGSRKDERSGNDRVLAGLGGYSGALDRSDARSS
jgi:hypothetical protein